MINNINIFEKAIKDNPNAQPLFHSDGGFRYTSPVFIDMLKKQGMTQSMSRIHCCIDNGPMEGFWKIMKSEMYYYGKHYNTKDELIKAIDEWITITCMKDIREDLESGHHMKSEEKHLPYKHQINIQYPKIRE